MKHILAADIGGTKTNLGLFNNDKPVTPVFERTFQNSDYKSFSQLLQKFHQESSFSVQRGCLAVAGPVNQKKVQLTNLPWDISAEDIESSFRIERVDIINDLVALGSSVPHLSEDDIVTLHAGNQANGGTIAVIAPGTGLGVSFSVWNGNSYKTFPSEGGHAGYCPQSEKEIELLRYLQNHHKHISIETLCSGSGIPNIYNFLRDSGQCVEPHELAEKLRLAPDPAPVIFQNALEADTPWPICTETVRMFVSILAISCSNIALTVMATGGVYIGGGIPPRIVSFLQEDNFLENFTANGKMSHLLKAMPVSVIINPKAALIGAAASCLKGV